MNTEIKFKVWNTEYNQWVEKAQYDIESRAVYVHDSDGVIEQLENTRLFLCTGIEDANGVEIYEGDLVYIEGYGDYEAVFPFIPLYEAQAQGGVGEILDNGDSLIKE